MKCSGTPVPGHFLFWEKFPRVPAGDRLEIYRERRKQMKLKKVWMAAFTGKKSGYAFHTLGGILGIVAGILLVTVGGVVLILSQGWSQVLAITALWLGVTVLGIWFALSLARRTVREDTVLLLTEEDRLFHLQARDFSYHGGGPAGVVAGVLDTQRFLEELARNPFVPQGAEEILQVESIRENSGSYAVRCRVRHPNGRLVLRSCILAKGMADEDLLLRELERRRNWRNDLEPKAANNLPGVLISTGVMAASGALCLCSHPAVAKLPPQIYFPCLAVAFAAFCADVYFLVRQRRGE